MKDLVFLTLTGDKGTTEAIAIKEKKEKAAEEMLCMYKNYIYTYKSKNIPHIYINSTVESISGFLIKGDYIGEIDINKWL